MRSAWNTGGRIDDRMKLRCLSDNPWGDGTEYLREENAELKAENARLKTELARYDWQEGHPEHERIANVYVKYPNGGFRYTIDNYDAELGIWEGVVYNDYEVLAYAEIKPYDGKE